jgi:hypothetical protein
MNCPRFETLLSEYADGKVDARVRSAAEQHLKGCPDCSALLAEVQELREDLQNFPEVQVSEELINRILEKTSGKPEPYSIWSDLVLPTFQPFMTQRYAFATIMMFVFISFAVNMMGPGFSVSSYSSSLVAKADQVSDEIYRKWREFNDLKRQVSEEIAFLKEDLLGRIDYHLVTVLFRSYSESIDDPDEEQTQEKSEEQSNQEENSNGE